MNEVNANLDLQSINTDNFELKDVQNLLDKFKNNSIKKEDFKKLDGNKKNLSLDEKKLMEQLNNSEKMISFLESVVKKIGLNNIFTLHSDVEFNLHNNSNLGVSLGFDQNLNKNLDIKLNNIISKYNSLDNLLENKNDRRKLLEIDTGYYCPFLSFKNNSSYGLLQIKSKIIEKEKDQISQIFDLYTDKNGNKIEVKDIFGDDACQPINLIEKLKGLEDKNGEKVSEQDILKILDGVSITKKTQAEDSLIEVLNKRNLDINSLKDSKGVFKKESEIKNILNGKNLRAEEIKNILNQIRIFQITSKIQEILKNNPSLKGFENELLKFFEKYQGEISTLNKTTNAYNNVSLDNILLQSEQDISVIINKITNKQKLITILKELKNKYPTKILSFNDFVNSSLSSDSDLFKEFYEINHKTKYENYVDVKNIDFSNLEENEKIEFLKIIGGKALEIIILQMGDEIPKNIDSKLLNKINSIKNSSEKLEEELELERILNKNIEDITSIEANLILNHYKYPKIFNKIINNPKLIELIITNFDYSFYRLLSTKKQKYFSIIYTNAVLSNNKDNKKIDKIKNLAFLQFGNFSNTIKILGKINESNILEDMIKKPLFRIKLITLMSDGNIMKELFKSNNSTNKNLFDKISKLIKKYGVKEEEFKNIYNTKITNRKSNSSEVFRKMNDGQAEKYQNLSKKITEKLGKNFDSKSETTKNLIIGFGIMISYDFMTGNKGNLDFFISELIKERISEYEFTNILEYTLDIIKEEQEKNEEELSTITITNSTNKNILVNILSENSTIDISKLKISFDQFVKENKDISNENGDKLAFGDEQWNIRIVELYFEEKGYDKITDSSLRNKIEIVLNGSLQTNKLTQKVIYSDILFQAHKTQDFTKYNELVKKGFYNSVEESILEFKISEENTLESPEKTTKIQDQNYLFNPESGIVFILENGEKTSFELSKQDKALVKEKPELLDKIINFHKTLNDLGLSSLWDIKDIIFQALTNKYPGSFEIKGNYLNKNETFIFLNSILKSTGSKEVKIQTIDGFKTEFKIKNNMQFDGGLKDDILRKGESSIEETFLEKYVNNFSAFQIGKFSKSLDQ